MWNNDEERAARHFYNRYLVQEPFPLDLKHIASAVEKELSIEIYFEECSLPEEITAQLRKGNYAALIYINRDHSLPRRRFAVAHEFGHLILGHRNGILCPGLGESDAEFEAANNFASALLMPETHLWKRIKDYPENSELIPDIAKHFGVSLEAAAKRVAFLDYFPVLFALLNPAVSRINWEYHSDSFTFGHEELEKYLSHYFRNSKNSKRQNHSILYSGHRFNITQCPYKENYLITCLPHRLPAPQLLCAKEKTQKYKYKIKIE